jgi:hypothetical protein
MDLELLGSLGWREGLMAIIALLVVYIVVLFFRMRRLQRSMAAIPPLAAQSAVAAYSAIQEPPPLAAAVNPAPPAGNDASAASVGGTGTGRCRQTRIRLERAAAGNSRTGADRCLAAGALSTALRSGRIACRIAGYP